MALLTTLLWEICHQRRIQIQYTEFEVVSGDKFLSVELLIMLFIYAGQLTMLNFKEKLREQNSVL